MSDMSTSFIKKLAGTPKDAPKQEKVNAYFRKLVEKFYKEFGADTPFVVSRLYEKGKEDYTDDKEPVKLNANNVAKAISYIKDNDAKYNMKHGNGGYYITLKKKENEKKKDNDKDKDKKKDK